MKTCFHKSLSSKTAGGGCLHDQNQTSYWLCFSEPLSQTKELKQKTDISLSRCSTFLPFLETLLFSHSDYFLINHCSYLRLTIIFSVQAPPPSHCIKHRHEWSPSCWRKFPPRLLIVFKTQRHLFANTSLIITPTLPLWKSTLHMLYNLCYHTQNVNSLVRASTTESNLTIPMQTAQKTLRPLKQGPGELWGTPSPIGRICPILQYTTVL